MKRRDAGWIGVIIGWILLVNISVSFASHEITHFRDHRKGAVSITFDDGYPSQVTLGVPLLNERNIKGTFFLITMPGWIYSHVDWETWREVARQGHEIGSTTINHPDLTLLPEGVMRWELLESRNIIEENVLFRFDPQDVVFAVNCGGKAHEDQTGVLYQTDQFFSGGQKRSLRVRVEGTEEAPLYQSERFGNFSYAIPIANGSYQVTLKFAEILFRTAGRRVFDVSMEDQVVLSQLDLFQQAGRSKAFDVTIPITVTDGVLNIDFFSRMGAAKVNAILIHPYKPCLSFAYPLGISNAEVQSVTADYYIAARGGWVPEGGFLNHYEKGPTWEAATFYNIGSYDIHEGTAFADLDHYLNLTEQRNAWFSVHFYEITDVDFFAQFFDHLLSKDIWVDTFGNIARYMQERIFSTLTVLSESASEIRLTLSHPLDPIIYHLPLTLRSSVPLHWTKVKVRQGNSTEIVLAIDQGFERVIYYRAVPNGGEILLTEEEEGGSF
jgi:hypothetical protein